MKPVTLFDELYRSTFASASLGKVGYIDQPTLLREHLREARRFVLDDPMSSFLIDLASAVFFDKPAKAIMRMTEQMRVLARLPYKRTWIEYSIAATTRRSVELGFGSNGMRNPAVRVSDIDPDLLAPQHSQGWLLDQNPEDESLFRVHVFERVKVRADKWMIAAVPFAYAWRTDDKPGNPSWSQQMSGAPWTQTELIVGIKGYKAPCGIVYNIYLRDKNWNLDPKDQAEVAKSTLEGFAAVLRKVWALLATVNELPVGMSEVAASKGFIKRGRYQQYLDYKTIILNVPQNADLRKIARNAIARSRMRAHQVRGHWRRNWRKEGERIWVHDHQRGDASLGFVMHDYSIERNPEAAESLSDQG